MRLINTALRGFLGSLLGLAIGLFLFGAGTWLSTVLDRVPSFDLLIFPVVCGIVFFLLGVFDLLPRTPEE